MKIIIIGPAYPLRGGGITSYNERLAREFQNQGHDVQIYTFSLQYPGFLFPGSTQYSAEPPPQDLKIKVCINSVNPINWIKVGNELKRLKADIIVVRYWLPLMGPSLGTILRRVKKNHFTKIVCIADNIIPHEKRPGDLTFTKYFMKPVDTFIAMSEKVMGDLRKLTSKPAKLVPHPLYDNFGDIIEKKEARKHLGIDPDDFVFLFFGFIRKYKGLDLLLEAVQFLKTQPSGGKNWKLLIAGEFYDDRKVYDELIEKLGIRNRLILRTDFIPGIEVKYYLCASDAVVQPYRNATQSGVTPLAYHFEVPMIVTNVGGLPSLVPHQIAGLVCEPTATSIASSMNEMLQTGTGGFIPHIREEKKKYSWNRITEAVIAN